jgi:hypothetical protein
MGEDQTGRLLYPQKHPRQIYSLGYGASTGLVIDPIEKKLFDHFLPGWPTSVDPSLMARDS